MYIHYILNVTMGTQYTLHTTHHSDPPSVLIGYFKVIGKTHILSPVLLDSLILDSKVESPDLWTQKVLTLPWVVNYLFY